VRLIFLVLTALAIATISGFGSAYISLSGTPPVGAVRIGAWTAWPRMGSREIDPYARAIVARSGELPLGLGEGLTLLARVDSAGAPLDSRCQYRLAGTMPAARAWTLTLFDDRGRRIDDPQATTGFTSANVLRASDGTTTIEIARDATPGNWLRLPETGRFMLALRLYETPVSSSSAALSRGSMPSIERLSCQ
jgi:hypothetical protein